MKKRLVIVLIILLLMCVGSFGVFKLAKGNDNNKNNFEDDNKRGNTTISESKIINLLENMEQDEYKVEDLTFKDATVFVNDGKDSFEATLLCDNARDNLSIEVNLYDKAKKKIKTLDFKLKDITEKDERILFCFVDENLFNVYSFDVEVK